MTLNLASGFIDKGMTRKTTLRSSTLNNKEKKNFYKSLSHGKAQKSEFIIQMKLAVRTNVVNLLLLNT